MKLSRTHYFTYLSLMLVTLAGFALRVYDLSVTELWIDEAFSYAFVGNSVSEMAVKTLQMTEPHPLGSYIIQRFFTDFAGLSEVGIRYPSAWFGTLSIAVMWPLAKRLQLQKVHRLAPLAAMALMACNALAVHYSREMRMYSMVIFFSALTTYLSLRLLQCPSLLLAVCYGASIVAALHIHYYAGFMLLAQNVVMLLRIRGTAHRTRSFAYWVLSQVIAIVFFVPWVIYAFAVLTQYKGVFAANIPLVEAVALVFGSFVAGGDGTLQVFHIFIAAFFVLCFAVVSTWLWRSRHDLRVSLCVIWICIALPFGVTWLTAQGRGTFSLRYVVSTLPFFLLMTSLVVSSAFQAIRSRTSASIVRVPRSAAFLSLLAVSALFGGGLFQEFRGYVYSGKTEWRDFVRLVQRYSAGYAPDEVRPAVTFPSSVFAYYYDPYGTHVSIPPRPNDAAGASEVVNNLRREGVRRVILKVQPSWWDPSNLAEAALSREYSEVATDRNDQWLVRIYSLVEPEEMDSVDVAFGDVVVLGKSLIRVSPVTGLIEVSVQWREGASALRGTEKMFIHVTPVENPADVRAQIDLPISPADFMRDVNTVGIRLPEQTPPGRYHVRVGVYDPGQPGAPRLTSSTGDDAVELMPFDIP